MILLFLFLVCVVAAGPGLWFWARALVRGRWRYSPGWFAGTAVLLLLATGVTYLVGALAGASLDPAEACAARGQIYDGAYITEHFDEQTRVFPLRNACNADYDLVPAWVNPALVVLPLPAVICLVFCGRLTVIHRRRTEKDPQ